MKQVPRVRAVVPFHHRTGKFEDFTTSTLESVVGFAYPVLDVIGVDDGSFAPHNQYSFVDMASQWHHRHQMEKGPDVQYYQLRNQVQNGFAHCVNQGAFYDLGNEPDYLLVLQPQVIVPRQVLFDLVSIMEAHPRMGAVGTVTNQSYGYGKQKASLESHSGKFQTIEDVHTYAREVHGVHKENVVSANWMVDHCMLIRYPVFKELEGFDTSYGGFHEENEFLIRMRKRKMNAAIHKGSFVFYGSLDGPITSGLWGTNPSTVIRNGARLLGQHPKQALQLLGQWHLSFLFEPDRPYRE